MFQKEKTPRSKEFRAFTKEQGCVVNDLSCKGDVVPAHQPLGEGGMGMKCSDFRVIPLCDCHHSVFNHMRGNRTFEDQCNISLMLEVVRNQERFLIKLLKDGRIK